MKKRIISAVLLTAMLFTGCGGNSSNNSGDSGKAGGDSAGGKITEITIPHYKVGQNVGAKYFVPLVDRFNEKYSDKYKINLEEVPNDSYREKMKQLALQDKLPPLIEGGDEEWLRGYIVPNDKFYDLSSFINETPAIKNVIIEDSLDFNTIDGKVYSMPLAVARPMGMFYNKSMVSFDKPIKEMTYDEFFNALGDNKIALMTSENAWTSLLLFSSLVAQEPGAQEVLLKGVREKITDFNSPMWVNAATKLQQYAQKYASSNTMGASYADAANSFMSKSSAVIYNGSWMIGDLSAGGEDKWSNGFNGADVGASFYPGNYALDNVQISTWWIPKNASEQEVEVALAFLEFMYSPEELEIYMATEGGISPNFTPSEKFIEEQKKNPLLYELNSSIDENTVFSPTFEHVVFNSISSQELGKLLPKLYDGSMTPEKFCEELTLKAKEAAQ